MSKEKRELTMDPIEKQIRELHQKYPRSNGSWTEQDVARHVEFARRLQNLTPELRRVMYHALPHLAHLAKTEASAKVSRNFQNQLKKCAQTSNDNRLKRDIDAAARRAEIETLKGGKAAPVPLKGKFIR